MLKLYTTVINRCGDCSNCEFLQAEGAYDESYNCAETGSIVDPETIPENCPLPDFKGQSNAKNDD